MAAVKDNEPRNPGFSGPANWFHDLQLFRAVHRDNPHISVDPLYALPSKLVSSIEDLKPEWLAPSEIAFETALSNLVSRNGAFGVFGETPLNSFLVNRTPAPPIPDVLIQKAGWDKQFSREDIERMTGLGNDRLAPIVDQLKAYVGWLLTNPEFLTDRNRLRSRWAEPLNDQIPVYPVQFVIDSTLVPPAQSSNDITEEMVSEFNSFYERWQLRRLVTWDLPEPLGANLSGRRLPGEPEEGNITLRIPNILHLPARYPIQPILDEIQREELPSTCDRGWKC